jgi:hypothetical protein
VSRWLRPDAEASPQPAVLPLLCAGQGERADDPGLAAMPLS